MEEVFDSSKKPHEARIQQVEAAFMQGRNPGGFRVKKIAEWEGGQFPQIKIVVHLIGRVGEWR